MFFLLLLYMLFVIFLPTVHMSYILKHFIVIRSTMYLPATILYLYSYSTFHLPYGTLCCIADHSTTYTIPLFCCYCYVFITSVFILWYCSFVSFIGCSSLFVVYYHVHCAIISLLLRCFTLHLFYYCNSYTI